MHEVAEANLTTYRIEGRPDFGNPDFGVTLAKRFPQYVYSTNRNACLIHRLVRVEIHWWDGVNDHMERLNPPRIIGVTCCGAHFFMEGSKSRTCAVPSPDAVLCGRCNGNGPTFRAIGDSWELRREAHKLLGCVAVAK